MALFRTEDLDRRIEELKASGEWDALVEKFEKQALEWEKKLAEGGYSGQGHQSGAESFYGTYYGFGGDMQLAAKLDPAVRKLKTNRDEEAGANFKQKQTRGRGYASSRQTLGISDDGDLGSNDAHFPGDELDQVGKTPQKLDAMYVSDPTKDYWSGEEVEEEPDVLADEEKNVIKKEDLNEQGGTAVGGGAGRSVASDGNYRDLQGFPRMNSIEEPMDFIPDVEGDIDGDGEEDEYLEDEEYVNDVLRMNGLTVKSGDMKKLFQDEELTEGAQKKKTAIIIKGNPKYTKGNNEANKFYEAVKAHLEENGYQVKFNSGGAYTEPEKADLWVGHSRGSDRLQFAPKGTRTVALGVSDGITHPKDNTAGITGKPSNDFQPNKFHYTLTNEMKKAMIGENSKNSLRTIFLEDGAFAAPQSTSGTERWKQGYWEEMPNGDDWLINHVDYSGGHNDIEAAEHSPGAHTYGNIATPKDFVPEDWEQRHAKTKEAPIDMESMETIEEMIGRIVREALTERKVMSSKNLVKKLRKNRSPGCDHRRQKGSHAFYQCGVCSTVVPMHGSKDVRPGTLRSIEKDLEGCLGDDWLDEAIQAMVREALGEAFTGIDDDTGKGKATGGSEAFNKSRKDVLDYDEKQKPEGTDDLENYHLGDDDNK